MLTTSVTLLLYIGGMNWFDAVCHAFATTATGGYSTKQASVAYWNSPFIEYVISSFMIISQLQLRAVLPDNKRQSIQDVPR